MAWKVKRRYNEFTWLASTLTKIYPGKNVPSLSEKSLTKNSANTIKKRKIMLEVINIYHNEII